MTVATVSPVYDYSVLLLSVLNDSMSPIYMKNTINAKPRIEGQAPFTTVWGVLPAYLQRCIFRGFLIIFTRQLRCSGHFWSFMGETDEAAITVVGSWNCRYWSGISYEVKILIQSPSSRQRDLRGIDLDWVHLGGEPQFAVTLHKPFTYPPKHFKTYHETAGK